MNKIKIFLTGGNGFIGKNILEILGGKYEFLAPGRETLDLLDSIAVSEYLKNNTPDIILHLAAAGGNRKTKDQAGVLQKNLLMFYNLCAGKKYFNRMIVFGSGAEYDKRESLHLVKEEDFGKSIPTDEYGLTKFTMAKFAENLDFITHLRFFGVFGKYEDYETRFISNAVCKAFLDLPITIKQNVMFDYLYINDFVKIADYFIEHKPKYKFYNAGRGEAIDLKTIAEKILRVLGKNLPISIAKEGLNKEYSCDVARLKEEIPGLVFTNVDQAIQELVKYYQSILPDLKKEYFLTDI